ncbi:hypothetical protein HanPSC8_Chr07g0284721 [Helianthus annuus]|nr:hypothetical protein HanPSC8_Chr07g0284721 [Helianthus annuus]
MLSEFCVKMCMNVYMLHNPSTQPTCLRNPFGPCCWTRDPGAAQAGIRPTPFLYGYKHTPLGFGFSFVQQGTHTISLDRNYRQPNTPLSRSSCSFETILPTGRG